ncbi:MAG: pyridine nucleotide-disulfide oxidoreductase [Epsilonproteobacteria bacterium]|nr:pyridine nucleotide-disulfide oxidoreductase [Campylobacterota bacterium]NPA63553.1 FAD-dependent oxidoreductase [Campylobacterota bacterium]
MHIVVLGGGYGGLRLIESLPRDYQITLIDKNPYHYLQTEAYEFLSGRKNICDITFSLQSFCAYFPNVSFVQDVAVALEEKEVVGKKGRYPFDRLVIAVGAEDYFPPFIKGLKERSVALKELPSAFGFKKAFLQRLFDEVAYQRPARIVVGGGGLSGVELAADFMSVARECDSQVGQCPMIEVILIEATESLLPGSSPFLQRATQERLEKLCVQARLNSPIQEVDERFVYLEGERIAYDLFIFAGGIQAAAFVRNLAFKKNRLGQLIVDRYLRVDDHIYAIGDCAQIRNKKGEILPPTAQIAEQSAEYVAAHITGRRKDPFNGRVYGVFVALGRNYAVGEIFGLKLKGRVASWMKELITKIYAWGIKIKVNSGYKKRL